MYITDNSAAIVGCDWYYSKKLNNVYKWVQNSQSKDNTEYKIVSCNNPKCVGIPQIHTDDIQKWIDNGAKDSIELDVQRIYMVEKTDIFNAKGDAPLVLSINLEDNHVIPVWEEAMTHSNQDEYPVMGTGGNQSDAFAEDITQMDVQEMQYNKQSEPIQHKTLKISVRPPRVDWYDDIVGIVATNEPALYNSAFTNTRPISDADIEWSKNTKQTQVCIQMEIKKACAHERSVDILVPKLDGSGFVVRMENKATDWIYEESSGYPGYRNNNTNEWIYETEYNNRFYPPIQDIEEARQKHFDKVGGSESSWESFSSGWKANPAKYTEQDLQTIFDKHKVFLNNLKDNRGETMDRMSSAESNLLDQYIRSYADILSDINILITSNK